MLTKIYYGNVVIDRTMKLKVSWTLPEKCCKSKPVCIGRVGTEWPSDHDSFKTGLVLRTNIHAGPSDSRRASCAVNREGIGKGCNFYRRPLVMEELCASSHVFLWYVRYTQRTKERRTLASILGKQLVRTHWRKNVYFVRCSNNVSRYMSLWQTLLFYRYYYYYTNESPQRNNTIEQRAYIIQLH